MPKKAKKIVKKKKAVTKEPKKKAYKTGGEGQEENVLNEEKVKYELASQTAGEDDLTEEQQKRLEAAIKEAKEGKTISYAELKKG